MTGVNDKRRRLLRHAAAIAATSLAGCNWWGSDAAAPLGDAPPTTAGGGNTPTTGAPPPAPSTPTTPSPPEGWYPAVPPLLVGSSSTFDLSRTLPSAVKRGGVFGIDAKGAALPGGMSMSAAGLLAVGSAAIGTIEGVIFTYEAP